MEYRHKQDMLFLHYKICTLNGGFKSGDKVALILQFFLLPR
jgi:hypothetical protein